MNRTIRTIGKWGLRLFLVVCFIEVLHITTLAFPYPLFLHKLEIDTLTMYSDQQIDSSMTDVLRDVQLRIEEIQIREPGQQHRIFLCQNQKLYSFISFLARMHPAAQGVMLSLFDNLFISQPNIDRVRGRNIYNFKHSHMDGNMAQVISHEIVHGCIKNQIGWWAQHSAPRWKQEGYCEYASTIAHARNDSMYDFPWRVKKLLENRHPDIPAHSMFYYQSQMLIEYLSEIEGMRFTEIMDEGITEQETLDKLRRWYGKL